MKRILALSALLTFALLLYLFVFLPPPAIRVTVINVSDKPLEDVSIGSRETSYSLGDIPVGGRAKKGFEITQDSPGIGLRHKGSPEGFMIHDGYLSRGHSGKLTVELDESRFVEIFNSID